MNKKLILAALFILIINSIFANETINLSCDDALELAINNNLSLKSSSIDLNMKKRAKNSSWNQFVPSLKFGGTYVLNNVKPDAARVTNPVTGAVVTEYEVPQSFVSFNLDMNFVLNLAMFMGIESAIKDYQMGLISYDIAVANLSSSIKKAYYNLILAKESIKILEDNISTVQKQYNLAKSNYKNGLVPEIVVLQVESSLEALKPKLSNQKAMLNAACMQFKINLGLDFDDEIILVSSVDDIIEQDYNLNSDTIVSKYIDNRLDVQSLVYSIDMLEFSKKINYVGSMTPSLIIGAGYRPSRGLYTDDSLTDPSTAEDWTDKGAFTIGFSLPVDSFFPFGKVFTSGEDIQDGINKLNSQLENVLRLSEVEIRSLVLNIETSKESIKSMELNEKLAQKVYNQNYKRFKSGMIEFLDLENSNNQLNQAKLGVIQEKLKLASYIVDLEKATNSTIGDLNEK